VIVFDNVVNTQHSHPIPVALGPEVAPKATYQMSEAQFRPY